MLSEQIDFSKSYSEQSDEVRASIDSIMLSVEPEQVIPHDVHPQFAVKKVWNYEGVTIEQKFDYSLRATHEPNFDYNYTTITLSLSV